MGLSPEAKASLLQSRREEKINNFNQNTNVMTGEELQTALSDIVDAQVYTDETGQYQIKQTPEGTQRIPFQGKTRNVYIDDTKTGNYKLGLAEPTGGFERRYNPLLGGWAPGPEGVTPENGALMDITVPYDKATVFEHDVHSNTGQIVNRAAGLAPTTEEKAKYGSGYTEYSTKEAPMWNMDAQIPEQLGTKTYVPEVNRDFTAALQEDYAAYAPTYQKELADSYITGSTDLQIPESIASGFAAMSSKGAELLGEAIETSGQGVEALGKWQESYNKRNPALEGDGVSQGIHDVQAMFASGLQSLGKSIAEEGTQIQTEQQLAREQNLFDETVGYDPRPVQLLGEEFADLVEKGEYLKAIGHIVDPRAITAFGQSISEMIVMANPLGLGGLMAANSNTALNKLEESASAKGVELTADDKALSVALSVVGTALDRLGDKTTLSSVDSIKELIAGMSPEIGKKVANIMGDRFKQAGIEVASILPKAAFEGVTEGAQTILEEKASDIEKMNFNITDEEYRQALEATGIGMAAGGVPSVATSAKAATKAAVFTPEQRKKMIDTIKQKKAKEQPIEQPIADVSEQWTPETDVELESFIKAEDTRGFKAKAEELLNTAETEEQAQEILNKIRPYLTAAQEIETKRATSYEDGSKEYKDISLNAEPDDILNTLTYIKDDAKANKFIDEVLSDNNFISKFNNLDDAKTAITEAKEARASIRELEGISETRGKIVSGGLDESRKGYIDYYRAARQGDERAKDNLYRFAGIHEEKANTMKADRKRLVADVNSELDTIRNKALTKNPNITQKDILIASLFQNNKIERKKEYKRVFDKVLATGVTKEELERKKATNKPYMVNYASDGSFEVNYDEAPMEVAILEHKDLVRNFRSPSPLSTTIAAVEREAEAMSSMIDKLEGKSKATKAKKAESVPEMEAETIAVEEAIAKEQEPITKETVEGKETLPEKEVTVEPAKEEKPVEQTVEETEKDIIEQEQAKEIEEITPKTIEEVKSTKVLKKPDTVSKMLNKLEKAGVNTKFFTSFNNEILQGKNEFIEDYIKRLDTVNAKITKAKGIQSGTEKELKIQTLDAIQNNIRNIQKAEKIKYVKEVESLKKEEAQAKELGKQIRKEIHAVYKGLKQHGDNLKAFTFKSTDEFTQQLIDERNALVEEIKSKEKGLRISISIMNKFLDSRITDPKKKAEMLDKLDSIHEKIGAVSEGKVTSLISALKKIRNSLAKVSTKLANKIDRFVKRLEDTLLDVRVLRAQVKVVNDALLGKMKERLTESYESERELKKAIGETTPRYAQDLITSSAFGTATKSWEELSPKTKENLEKFGYSKKDFINIENLLDVKKVNSDFARYDIALSEDDALVSMVEMFASDIETAIPENVDVSTRDTAELAVKDYARGLVFNKDGKLDRNIAGAMLASVSEELDTAGSKYLRMSPEEISRMYNIDMEDLDASTINQLAALGVPAKYMTASLGKSTMDMMGLKRKEGADSNQYDDLVASVGNMSMYAAEQAGFITINEIENSELDQIFETKSDNPKAKSYFVKLNYDKLSEIKNVHKTINDKLVIPSTKKNVRFSKRKFDEKDGDCHGM